MPERAPCGPGRRTRRRRTSGSSGSRAMWAISGGSSAPPAETASPPNIRWSTKRSSGRAAPSRAKRHPQVPLVGGAGRLDQHLAAHAEVGRAGRRRCRAAARGTCRGAGRRRRGDRSARRRSPSGPRGVAPHRARVQHLDRARSVRPTTWRSSPAGRPRPRAARARVGSGRRSSSAGRRRPRLRRPPCSSAIAR